MLGDKEIAVRIRSNSHYRISCESKSSRNAYRFAIRKGLLGNWGDCGAMGEQQQILALLCYGRMAEHVSQYPGEGTFILSFCKEQKG